MYSKEGKSKRISREKMMKSAVATFYRKRGREAIHEASGGRSVQSAPSSLPLQNSKLFTSPNQFPIHHRRKERSLNRIFQSNTRSSYAPFINGSHGVQL